MLVNIFYCIGNVFDLEYILLEFLDLLLSDNVFNCIFNIYFYVFEYFRDMIMIKDIVKVVNLSEYFFCRYFKKIFKKLFFYFLVELCINYVVILFNEID